MLTEHGIKIAPSTYYQQVRRTPTVREQREEVLKVEIARVHRENFAVYGARKVWPQLNREGIPGLGYVARCTVERLMRELGLTGAVRGRVKNTTVADPAAERAEDLVAGRFAAKAPDRLWVMDITYLWTWSGWVYVALVTDAYARRILGWRCGTSMTTQLVLDALEQAIWTGQRAGANGNGSLESVVAHSDRGSQGGFHRSSQHHLKHRRGGVWCRKVAWTAGGGGSGGRIGRCGRGCGRRGVRDRVERWNDVSGG